MEKEKKYLEMLKQEQVMSEENYQYLELCEFSKGEYLLHQGQKLEYLYILVSGRIKSCHTSANGTTVVAAFYDTMIITGEAEFLNHREVINDVYALENSVCFKIAVNLYESLLLNDLIFMRYLARTLAMRLYRTNQNTAISINYPVESRLASYLLASANHLFVEDNFVVVAELIGSSYRQLQRVLNDFCQKGYIKKIKRGRYQIIEAGMLERLGQDLYHI